MKSIEVKAAERRVERDLESFDESVDELIHKIEGTTDSVQHAVEAVQAPIKKVRQFANTVCEKYDIDSETFLLGVGLGTFCVFALGSFLRVKNRA